MEAKKGDGPPLVNILMVNETMNGRKTPPQNPKAVTKIKSISDNYLTE
jgi:hypothetical protein